MERRRHLDTNYEKHRIRIRAITAVILIVVVIALFILSLMIFGETPEQPTKVYTYDTFYYDEDTGVYYAYISELETLGVNVNGSKVY